MARIQRRFLLGSRWTALPAPAAGRDDGDARGGPECHFEVVTVERTPDGDQVTLRAVLTARHLVIPRAALDEVARWAPGWRSLP